MNDVTNKLNTILSDALVMYTKLHNYHWNIKGMEFYNIHEKTEQMYNYFSVVYDDVAERVLQLEATPVVTLKEILKRATITEEEQSNFNAKYVIENVLADYKIFLSHFKELGELEGIDQTTSGYADEKAAELEKEIWMLKSMSN